MQVLQTLTQRIADARQHCDGCENRETLKDSWVMCSGVRVGFVNGRCPRELWDHSAPIEKSKPAEPVYHLCKERIVEEWDDDWQQRIRASAIHETDRRIAIPLDLYEEALKHRRR